MDHKLKHFSAFMLVAFALIALILAVSYIWDLLAYATIVDAFVKVAFTFAAVYLFGMLVMFFMGNNK